MTQLDRLEALAEKGEAWVDFFAQDEAAPDVTLADLIRVTRAAAALQSDFARNWADRNHELNQALAPLFAEVES